MSQQTEPQEITRSPLAGDADRVAALLAAECGDPHALLGAHPLRLDGAEGIVVRTYHPGARDCALLLAADEPRPMAQVAPGLFACFVPRATKSSGYPR